MKFKNLIAKNNTHFSRYYRLVAFAVTVAIAVIIGSLVIGDSVRSTLVKRVDERLGNTETVIFTQNSFLDQAITNHPLFENKARGVLLTNGFVSVAGKLIPVMVWGVNDMNIEVGKVKTNASLQKELAAKNGTDIVLRLPATGLVPSGSLFVTDTYTTSLRLMLDSVVGVESGGNISLKNEQTIPYNVFVNGGELAKTMAVEGKINVILHEKMISDADFDSIWNYSFSGLKINKASEFTEITSDRIFIQEKVVETICQNNPQTNRLFSYLANSIEKGDQSIPYSFVTAVDQYKGQDLKSDEIILSDYAAKRLNAKQNDTISVSYYTSHDLKTLKNDSVRLIVRQIVPLAQLQADSALKADFPGLSNVERCTDWNSDLPIDMKRISKEDEAFWSMYKNTPKAIVSYRAIASDWSNAYGSATTLRIDSKTTNINGLTPDMFGVQIIHPRQAGLRAAESGVDFSSLFLSLGFFIILSAMLLMQVPLFEMLYKRKDEIDLLKSLGFSRKRITRILWMESAPVVLVSSIIGVIFGLAYTYIILFLLGSVWKGATHTEGFGVYPDLVTIGMGLLVGIVISMLVHHISIRRTLNKQKKEKKIKKYPANRKLIRALLFTLILFGIMVLNFIFIKSTVLFVCTGFIFIVVAWFWIDYVICRYGSSSSRIFDFPKLIWATLYANRKQALLSFFTLSIGVFIVFSVGLNRQGFADSSQLLSGTGGYSLWCENSVPIYHNIMTQDGRKKLALTDLPTDTQVLQLYKYSADDASCLNLNKVTNPSVLGIDMDALRESDFAISQSIYTENENDIFNKMKNSTNSVYPALVDETVLLWGLGKKLGDTLVYEGENGHRVAIQLAGTLTNSIFQGNILIDKKLFSEIWAENKGSEIMLVKVSDSDINTTKTLLSQALKNYGIRIMTTNERLQLFYSVTDTYLTIFMTLGGLGLMLGIMSFIIVVRKNLASRQKEIELYRSLGYTDKKIERLLYYENMLIPFLAIVTGIIGSLAGVSATLGNISLWIWLLAFVLIGIFMLFVLLFIKISVNKCLEQK